jgi:hypothetical protein
MLEQTSLDHFESNQMDKKFMELSLLALQPVQYIWKFALMPALTDI